MLKDAATVSKYNFIGMLSQRQDGRNHIRRKELANKKTEQPAAAETPRENKYRDGRWTTPSRRAKGYAADRKARVHTYGPKEGKPLSDFEAGMRSGYLQCQGDHAGIYKFKKALAEGKSRDEALALSKKPWGKKNNGGDAA